MRLSSYLGSYSYWRLSSDLRSSSDSRLPNPLKRTLVPLTVGKAGLELHLGTIPVRLGLGWVGLGGMLSRQTHGYNAISVQLKLQFQLPMELSFATILSSP